MGIYPSYRKTDEHTTDDGCTEWVEERHTPGLVERREVRATAWTVHERSDCFCCTCPDEGGMDPYCRNHGGAHGERPCEKHGMPGATDPDDRMPDSVQVKRARIMERRR